MKTQFVHASLWPKSCDSNAWPQDYTSDLMSTSSNSNSHFDTQQIVGSPVAVPPSERPQRKAAKQLSVCCNTTCWQQYLKSETVNGCVPKFCVPHKNHIGCGKMMIIPRNWGGSIFICFQTTVSMLMWPSKEGVSTWVTLAWRPRTER